VTAMRPEDAKATAVAYREIKSRILDLRYVAGEKLSETRLSAELGLGRSPIRTALARLKEEGWIDVAPQSGTYVRALSEKEVEDVVQLRLILEMHVARIAARDMPTEEVRRLRSSVTALRPEMLKGNVEGFWRLDEQVHSGIYRAAGNQLITELLQSLREKVRWVLPQSADLLQRQHAVRELERIIGALEARDAEAAAQRMREHVGDSAEKRKKIGNAPPTRRHRVNESVGASARATAAIGKGRSRPGRHR
jgi:DNA-binding GntR family transcriptional regulator